MTSGIDLPELQRVNVVGTSGSGKSTFSQRLAEILQSSYIQMDQLFHGPNWTEPTIDVFRDRIRRAVASDRWVLDGNYHSKTYDLKWQRASAVIWIDPSLPRVLWQVSLRAFDRAWSQRELWPSTGNRESFRRMFSKDSIILWSLTSYPRLRRRYGDIQRNPPYDHLKFIRLRGARASSEFLCQLRSRIESAR